MLNIIRLQDTRVGRAWKEAEDYIKEQPNGDMMFSDFTSDLATHAPAWHAYPAGRHNELVVTAALIVSGATGINIVAPMALHDIGKVTDFVRYWQKGKLCADFQQYNGHEERSAEIAASHGLDEEECFLIRWHALAYRCLGDVRSIFEKCGGDKNLLARLVLVFACDTFGKGWPEAQKKQRPQIAEFVGDLCQQYEFAPLVQEIAQELILDGKPV